MLQLNIPPTEYNNFYKSLQFVLKWEGGYNDTSGDSGGETKFGISKRAYPNLDIKSLSAEDAAKIYYEDYWKPSGCQFIDYPLCTCVFDSAVNCGVSKAAYWLKQSEGKIDDYLNLRRDYYISIVYHNSEQAKFLKGWLSRLADLQKLSAIDG